MAAAGVQNSATVGPGANLPQRSALPHLRKGWGVPASRLPPQGLRRARAVADPHCCSVAAEGKAPLGSGGRGPNSGVGAGGGAGSLEVTSRGPSVYNFLGRGFAAWVMGVPEGRNGVFLWIFVPSSLPMLQVCDRSWRLSVVPANWI